MTFANFSPAVMGLNGLVYVAGGSNGHETSTVQAYNPSTNTWATLANMPAGRYASDGAVAINGKLYVPGGWDNTTTFLPHSNLFIYNPATNSWSSGASLPLLSAGGVSAAIDGKLYVTTPDDGYSGYYTFLNAYDPVSNTWSSLAAAPHPQSGAVGGVIDGKLYVAGGTDGSDSAGYLDVYDSSTNTWTSKAPLPYGVGSAAGGVLNGKLYVIGGGGLESNGNGSGVYLNTVEVYDPVTNTWTTDTPAPTARSGAGGAVVNGVLYVVGGSSSSGILATNEAFTPASLKTVTVIVSDSGGTYDGQPFPATAGATNASGQAVNGSFTFTYYSGSSVNGSGTATAPTNAGTYTVVASFTSADPNYGNAQSSPVTFTITPITLGSPTITSVVGTIFTTGVPNRFTITTTGNPTPVLSESGALPAGISFKDNGDGTASLFGTPIAGTDGAYAITFRASNSVAPNATQTFSLTITEASTPNECFVVQLYEDLLGRPPDGGGSVYWTNLLNQGSMTRAQVALQILNSQEYQADLVKSLYEKMLDRSAQPSEVGYWLNFLSQGGTDQQLEEDIAGSSEYYQNRGGGYDLGFLAALYGDALQRAIDTSGQTYFRQEFGNGMTPAQVAQQIFTSSEYVQELVGNDYQQFLHRNADPGGLSYFLGSVQNGMTDEQIIANILGSQEYYDDANKFDPTVRFVDQAYEDLLGRPADAGGQAYFTGLLNQGSATRAQVALMIATSPEAETLEVEQLYQLLLHRSADATGLTIFTGLLAQGDTREQIAGQIAGSAEYYGDQGGGTNDGFVTALFQDALGRTPQPQELTQFNQAFANGATLAQIAADVFSSPEYVQDEIGGFYQQYLRRSADSAGLSYFVNAREQGASDEQVIAQLVGSTEGYAQSWTEISSLSTMSAMPGTLLTITGSGFDPKASMGVRFYDNNGYDVTVPVAGQENNTLTVAVPPFVDRSTGNFVAGTVAVQVVKLSNGLTTASGPVNAFHIQAPLSPAAAPGVTLENFLQGEASFAATLQTQLLGSSLDTAALNTALSSQISNLQALASNVQTVVQNPTQTFSLGTLSGEQLTIGAADLHRVEQVILGTLLGQGALEPSSAAAALANYILNNVPPGGSPQASRTALSGVWREGQAASSEQTDVTNYLRSVGKTFAVLGAAAGVAEGLEVFGFAGVALVGAGVSSVLLPVTLLTGAGLVGLGYVLNQSTPAGQATAEEGISLTLGASLDGIIGAEVKKIFGEGGGKLFGLISGSQELIETATEHADEVVPQQSLSFSWLLGGSATGSQSLIIKNGAEGDSVPLNWTIGISYPNSAVTGWLSSGQSSGSVPAGGSVPDSISLVRSGDLQPGTYEATVTIADPDATNSPIQVPVTLTVLDPEPAISVQPQTLTFTAMQGGSSPAGQSLQISNTGSATSMLNFTATASAAWLQVSGSSSTVSGGQSVDWTATANPSGLAPGTYNATITIADQNASNSPQTVQVTLTITPQPQTDPFAGSYQGTYTGTAFLDNGVTYPLNGPVDFTEANGVITVTVPATGTGTLSTSGSASFTTAVGIATSDNATIQFSGTFTVTATGVTASGDWSSSFPPSGPIPGGSANGTWEAQLV